MDFSAISNPLAASASAAPAAAESANSASPAPGASAFGGVLQSLLPPQERQELAAPQGSHATDPALVSAKTLGLQLEIITPATPVPADASLAAFARNQGLDETAIQALFGSADWFNPALNAVSGTAAESLTPTNSEAIGLGLTPNSPDMQSLWSFGAVALPAQSQAAMPGTGTLAAASPNAPSGGAATAAMLNSFSAPHSALTPQTRTPEALAAQALLATAEDAAFSIQNLVLGAAQPTATEVSDEAMALQLRLSVQPSTLTTRLMNMKATELTQAWSQLMTPVTAPPKGEAQELMLEIGEELMASLEAHTLALDTPSEATSPTLANPLSGEVSGKSAQASSTVAPGNAPATLGQQFRNDQIQQLADKMGQAMADRLQQQIAKGEWSLQLRMNPAQLGQVDVTLDMSAAGLDAVFNADNAMTRELIALGSQKLKDSLTQSGTTVANVYINGDGGRQSGGNSTGQPTPQHPRAQARSAPDATIAAPRAAEARIMRSDGWDALA